MGYRIDPAEIKCVVFDFGFTLSSDYYFKNGPMGFPQWHGVIQRHIFGEPDIVNSWMKGVLSTVDIAGILSGFFPMGIPAIMEIMEKSCEHLNFNQAVWDFAASQRTAQRKTALVTANMDVFTKIVTPSHGLDKLFDVILNTSDYKELHKETLWPIAFDRLGNGINYSNSLLIEDDETETAKFRSLGGHAYRYSTDEKFSNWLSSLNWNLTDIHE